MFDLQSRHLSSGAYGQVYETLIPNVVMKTAFRDPSWVYWIAFCIQYGEYCPFLPRIYTMTCNPRGHEASVLMERLTSGEHEYWVQTSNRKRMLPELQYIDPQLANAFKAFLEHLDEDARLGDEFRLDAHYGNWMFRGDQVVLTDPVAGLVFYDTAKSPLFQHERIKIQHA